MFMGLEVCLLDWFIHESVRVCECMCVSAACRDSSPSATVPCIDLSCCFIVASLRWVIHHYCSAAICGCQLANTAHAMSTHQIVATCMKTACISYVRQAERRNRKATRSDPRRRKTEGEVCAPLSLLLFIIKKCVPVSLHYNPSVEPNRCIHL